jgi:hypothetical protein
LGIFVFQKWRVKVVCSETDLTLKDLGCAVLEGYIRAVRDGIADTLAVDGYKLYCALELPYIDQEEWDAWVNERCPENTLSFQRT